MTTEELQVVLLSLRVALQVVLVSLLPGVLVAWVLARWHSPWCALLRGVVMLPLVLPPVVTGYVLLHLLGRGSWIGGAWESLFGSPIAYTTTACTVAAAVVGFPLLVESVRLSIAAVDERLESVARTLGRGRVATFLSVTLPLARPGLFAGAVLAFARSLGEFGATIVLAGNVEGETRQIPLAVYTLLNEPGRESEVLRLVVVSAALALTTLLIAARLQSRGRGRRER